MRHTMGGNTLILPVKRANKKIAVATAHVDDPISSIRPAPGRCKRWNKIPMIDTAPAIPISLGSIVVISKAKNPMDDGGAFVSSSTGDAGINAIRYQAPAKELIPIRSSMFAPFRWRILREDPAIIHTKAAFSIAGRILANRPENPVVLGMAGVG